MEYNFSDKLKGMSGTATREIFKLLSRPEIISFAGGLPATECLPIAEMRAISEEILASETDSVRVLQYGTTEGFPELRSELGKYVTEFLGKTPADSELLVISGGQQGIDLLLKSFINKGDVVLVEDPTYLAFLQLLNSYEGKAVGVSSSDEGLDLDDLEDKIIRYKPKMLYVVPTFSNPTGKTYTMSNRAAIAALTARYGVIVIEDDPYSRLRFSGSFVPPMKTVDRGGNIIYLSSLSKVMSPGLRVGAAVGDERIIRKMSIGKQGTDLHTSNMSQLMAAKYLQRGLLNPNVEKSLPLYLERKNAMIEAIEKYMPEEFNYTNPDGGLFIWGELPEGINTVTLLPEAIEKNVAYIQGQVFFADNSGLNTLRLNYSNASPEKIEKGIKALGGLLKTKISEL